MYFESHAHYDDKRYNNDREAIIEAIKESNVGCVVNIGATLESSKRSVELTKKYEFFYASVGVHPHDAKSLSEERLNTLEALAKNPKVVAIGEIGLDYYYEFSPRDTQREWYKKQLDLANRLSLPVIIHSRDAAQETFDILKDSPVREGVIHCYSGSAQMAKGYEKMGFYIGVGGVVTFKGAKDLVETVAAVSLDKILIETDCPYLSPEPFRGQRNDSTKLKYVVKKIAEIKGITEAQVEEATEANARKLFFKKGN